MSAARDLLVEVGTEELPPRALRRLAEAFAEALGRGLDALALEHGALHAYATPRRLAVRVEALAETQPERHQVRRGPALAAAFDGEGRPTRAALGFARSLGVELERLERIETDKGVWLGLRTVVPGAPTAALLPELVCEVLAGLPAPRRMRWGWGEVEFVRPVHWVVLLFGEEPIEAEVLGVDAGRSTRGHRFHHPGPIEIRRPADYPALLAGRGRVIADLDERRERIRAAVEAAARGCGGVALIEEALLEEVTALVEWPVAVAGSFDREFLELPEALLVAVMRDHQRYFPVVDDRGQLLARFVTVSNIESRNPAAVRSGNERVIRPRFADARFFFEADLAEPLAARRAGLAEVVFHERLGSLADKSARVAGLAARIAAEMGLDEPARARARRAGELAKCDLLTQMVGEFPELQGEMGRVYAERGGEPPPVAEAIGEHYRPRFAGDAIPASALGRALALADRLDTLVGIFAAGQPPSGDKDPYALRRAALGALRILIEGEIDLDLEALLAAAAAGYGEPIAASAAAAEVFTFALERLRGYFLEQGVPADVYAAVLARRPTRPLDFARRVRAVEAFRALPEAAALAAANKRIANILRQAGGAPRGEVEERLLEAGPERELAARLAELEPEVRDRIAGGEYRQALERLATLRDPVDAYFDGVRVMAEDERLRGNRLALLARIHRLFLATADIARLQQRDAGQPDLRETGAASR